MLIDFPWMKHCTRNSEISELGKSSLRSKQAITKQGGIHNEHHEQEKEKKKVLAMW